MSTGDMSHADLTALIGTLTEGEMRQMLTYIAGYQPEAFDRALARVRPS